MSTLYIVATPIGNLEDTSFRAIRILHEVDLILSEDTRETTKLLNHYNIKTSQISYRDQNHTKIISKILEILGSGKTLALVSDSGTPLISDPGFKLVASVLTKGHIIVPIPGPSACVAALSASGLPTDKFVFLGFLPKKPNARKELLQTYGKLDCTLTIYESPYRVRGLLRELYATLGDRNICLAKDITKKYATWRRGSLSDLIANSEDIKEKGEYVVLVAKEGF